MCLVTQLYPTLCDHWTVACQAPLSMGFSGQEHWSRSPLPSPGDLPNLGIEPTSPVLAGGFFIHWAIGKHLANSCGLIAKSCPTLCDPMDCSLPASLSRGLPRQEHQSGLPFHSPGDLPHSGITPGSPTLQANSLPTETPGKPKHSCEYAANSSFPCWDFLGFFFFFKYLDPQLVESMASQPTDTRADCPNSTPTLTSKDKRQNTWP